MAFLIQRKLFTLIGLKKQKMATIVEREMKKPAQYSCILYSFLEKNSALLWVDTIDVFLFYDTIEFFAHPIFNVYFVEISLDENIPSILSLVLHNCGKKRVKKEEKNDQSLFWWQGKRLQIILWCYKNEWFFYNYRNEKNFHEAFCK